MTPEEAGAAAVADWPPLTDEEVERLVFIIAPSARKPTESGEAACSPKKRKVKWRD